MFAWADHEVTRETTGYSVLGPRQGTSPSRRHPASFRKYEGDYGELYLAQYLPGDNDSSGFNSWVSVALMNGGN